MEALAWQGSPGMVLATDPNPAGANTVQQYLNELVTSKLIQQNLAESQGIWVQSGPMLIASYQGTTPLPAASLTKIATSLAAFKTLGPEHQFQTLISATGPVQNGVLQGDLVVTGGSDPMFVWEEAIAIGNTLNQMGIKQIKGNLVITGNFTMNYMPNQQMAGQSLKEAMNSATWGRPAIYSYALMPKGSPKPKVIINGQVKIEPQVTSPQTLLVRHYSLPLKQIIKEMNVYSNNEIAQMLADAIGGHTVVQTTAAQLAKVPYSEIQLINGSGLGPENRISPRAVCAMLMVLQKEAFSHQLTLADLFPTSGFDDRGTMHSRKLPNATVMKTGTLRDVSALGGVFPTRDRGLVWFAIINRGSGISGFRQGQDQLLQNLVKQLQVSTDIPLGVTPHSGVSNLPPLGDSVRNEILLKS
jgi:D-alanyl-D-alanine carboxypeptidase/D-alanyl-D-alanine-endopeptidase (penicillin-binding protein 4)